MRRTARATRLLLVLALGVGTAGAARAQGNEAEITHPVAVHQVPAEYPEGQASHADVILIVTIDATGAVTDVHVDTSGGAAFDEAAVEAVRKWTFSPATRNGKAMRAVIKVPFHFTPPAPPPPPPPPPPPAPPPPTVAPKPPPAEGTPPKKRADEVEDVVVYGPSAPPTVCASDIHFRFGDLARAIPLQNASFLLRIAAPSLLLTNEGGEGHAEQVFLRGFDAGDGQDLEFTVDGVPINDTGNQHGNGYADTHFIIPELVESVRVLEGPFDPRQGNYAVAGSADFELGLAQRGLSAKYTAGTWGTQRGLVLWGPEGTSERTFAGADLSSTQGFGQNRDALRGSAMAQYEGRLGQKGLYHLTAQGYATQFHSPGLIREDDYEAGRIGFYDSYDTLTHAAVPQGGDASRYSVAGDIETRTGSTTLTQKVFLIKRDMRILENFTGFVLDPRGDEIDLHWSGLTFGAKGSAKLRAKALGQKQELEVGYYARGDDSQGMEHRLEATTGNPYATDADLHSTLGDIGLYADANLRALSWINLRGGVRSDILTYDVYDGQTSARTALAKIVAMPRASLILGPAAGFSFSGSVGTGVRTVDPSDIVQDVTTPFANVTAYEGAVTFARTLGPANDERKQVRLDARSIFFSTHVDHDLVFSEIAGKNVLNGGTTRTGWVGSVRATGKYFDGSTSMTLVRATEDDTGLPVPYVPQLVFRTDATAHGDLPFRLAGSKVRGALGAGLTYVGPRDLPYGLRSGELFTLDATATLTWKQIDLGIIGTNITDNHYRLGEYNYVSDFHTQPPSPAAERMFSAGAPLGVFVSLGVRLGG